MSESGEIKPTLSRKDKFKRLMIHTGLAVGTTFASLIAPAPQEVHSQESIIQTPVSEGSPAFFTKEIFSLLQTGMKANIAIGTFNISPEAKISDHFLGISDQLKNPLIVEQKAAPEKTEIKKIQNPLVIEHGGEQYIVWFEQANDGSKKPVALAMNPDNWGSVAREDGNSVAIYDKNQDILPISKMVVNGMAKTNYNRDLNEEMFTKDLNGNPVRIMSSLPSKIK